MAIIVNRREFVGTLAGAAAVVGNAHMLFAQEKRRMTMDLVCGAIGVRADQFQAIGLAAKHGFESVGADSGHLARMSADERKKVLDLLQEKGLVLGAAGLPVEFRREEQRFRDDLAALPKHAEALQSVGVTRVGTWIMPNHDALTYRENFKLHVTRLKEAASILRDHGLRLGLEYVGPKTLWTAARYSFVHSMKEAKELIGEIGVPNVGFVLDSWHWYTAKETVDDLMTLRNENIVAVDLNDAPEGLDIDEQLDQKRRLPASTGVIDVGTFLKTLVKIGYDGPVRAEPFDASLREMEPDAAVARTAAAMKKAFALIG